jgi:hypothetical protein
MSIGSALIATPDLLSRAHYGDRLVTPPPGFRVPDLSEDGLPADPGHRLGRYFERLVEAALRALDPLRLHHGVIIREGKQVVGELDFVFQLPGEDFARHWEVSCKYYLAFEGRYLGLMTRDRIDLKLDRLMNHQLRLPERPATLARLAELGYPERVVSQAWVKGTLFYRESALEAIAMPPPPEVSPGHWRGSWSLGVPEGQWVPLPKPRWLVPYRGTQAPLDRAAAALLPRPVMLARVERNGEDWVERSRHVAVNEAWIEAATRA